jgi:hypothetical protein
MRINRTLNQVLLAGSACVALFAAAPIAWSATTSLTTVASPDVTLSGSNVTLIDSATLSGGFNPTGTITFTLTSPSGPPVDTETVAVNGNGAYATPVGFTVPTSGTVVGTYSWTVIYSGDVNNNPATDQGTSAEQTVVSPASPRLGTAASPGGLGSTLTDIALLLGGFNPTGTITFTLTSPSGPPVDTETVAVNGNGAYTTPVGFTVGVAGTYFWTALYSGDGNNNTVTASLESVSVGSAVPEPSTWAMMLLGFAGLGLAFRQSRRKVSFA